MLCFVRVKVVNDWWQILSLKALLYDDIIDDPMDWHSLRTVGKHQRGTGRVLCCLWASMMKLTMDEWKAALMEWLNPAGLEVWPPRLATKAGNPTCCGTQTLGKHWWGTGWVLHCLWACPIETHWGWMEGCDDGVVELSWVGDVAPRLTTKALVLLQDY